MSHDTIIHEGVTVGHLLVVAYLGSRHRTGLWECECACGRHCIKRTDSLLKALKCGYSTGCGRGCGMRRTNRRAQGLMDDTALIDWGQTMRDYHDLIARYREGSRHDDAKTTTIRDEWAGDLTGRHISHLTVVSQSHPPRGSRNGFICECACECGARFTRRAADIRAAARRGDAQYCASTCPVRLAKRAPLAVGDRIGHLVIVSAPRRVGHARMCECRCDCGAYITRPVGQLRDALKRGIASRCSPTCPSRFQPVTSTDPDAGDAQ